MQQKNKLQEQQAEGEKTDAKSSTDYFYDVLKKQGALPVAPSPLSINYPTLNLGVTPPVAQAPVAPTSKPKHYAPIFSIDNYQFVDVN